MDRKLMRLYEAHLRAFGIPLPVPSTDKDYPAMAIAKYSAALYAATGRNA